MYLPAHFTETDPAAIAELVAAHPLATLVAQGTAGLVANHLPLILHQGALIGHVARANPLHELLAEDAPVLAIFQGPEGYVSANDYPSKARTHEQVPTWNYQVVHIHGSIRFQHDANACRAAAALLTRRMETAVNGARAWRMSDAPRAYMERMVAGIVALRIEITQVAAKFKLSQNKSPEDRQGAAAGLAARGAGAVARQIKP